MHEGHLRCSGYVVHDVPEDGRAALRTSARSTAADARLATLTEVLRALLASARRGADRARSRRKAASVERLG
jgi:hypothetical protein